LVVLLDGRRRAAVVVVAKRVAAVVRVAVLFGLFEAIMSRWLVYLRLLRLVVVILVVVGQEGLLIGLSSYEFGSLCEFGSARLDSLWSLYGTSSFDSVPCLVDDGEWVDRWGDRLVVIGSRWPRLVLVDIYFVMVI